MAANANHNPSAPFEELPVVEVFTTGDGVVVKWDNEETTATHSTLYSDAPYSFSAIKTDQKEPFFKTFGSLLNCSGGILTIGQTRYRIQAQQQQQQQQDGKLRCCFRGIHCAGRTSI